MVSLAKDHGPVLHVSADYPDAHDASKARVIRTLVELAADRHEQRVISLNRISPPWPAMLRPRPALRIDRLGGKPDSWLYHAPPKGVWHKTMLEQLGEAIARHVRSPEWSGPPPRLIIGHKLTVEGIAVHHAAKLLQIPFGISIQGDTDTNILSVRRDLSGLMGKVFHEAAVVFPFAPWALTAIEQKLGKRSGPTIMLPCPIDNDTPVAPQPGNGTLLSTFHLKNWKRKNLPGIVAAAAIAARARPVRVEIIGGGSDDDRDQVSAIIANSAEVSAIGPMTRDAMIPRFNAASGFVMPSLRESFGLVFIEALFAGLPIVYPRGTAVSGYFDGLDFAIGVNANSPQSIADGMASLLENEAELKRQLHDWQSSSHADQFRRTTIGHSFSEGINAALSSRS